jgi:hypothetical protein
MILLVLRLKVNGAVLPFLHTSACFDACLNARDHLTIAFIFNVINDSVRAQVIGLQHLMTKIISFWIIN